MLPRALEVLLVILLVIITCGVALQYRNHELLTDILQELRSRPQPVTLVDGDDAVALRPKTITAPATATPNDHPKSTAAEPNVDPPKPPAAPKPEPVEPATPKPPTPTPTTSPSTAPSTGSDSPQWQKQGPAVTKFIEQLLDGDYNAVIQQFNTHMQTNLSKAQLAAVMDPVRKAHGKFKQITSTSLDRQLPPSMNVFKVGVEMTDGHPLQLTITIDAQQHIAGLMMK